MNQFFLFPLTAFLFNLFIGLLILLKNHQNTGNRLYALFAISCSLWAFGDFLNFLSFNTALISKYFTITFAALTSIFFFHFVLFFTKNRLYTEKRVLFLYIPSMIFISINSVTSLIVKEKISVWWGYASKTGELYLLFTAYVLFYIIAGIILCLLYYKKSTDKKQRKHSILLIIALIIPLLMGISTQIVPRILNISIIDLTTTSTIMSAIIIGYGIFKHEFISPMSFTYTKKISILVLIVVIICLSLILVPGVTFASDSAVKNAFEDIEYAANTKSEYISLYLEELEHTTTSLSESIWLTNYFDDQHNITIDYLNQELENIHQNHPEFEDIEIFDKYGIVMASSNQSMIGLNKRKSTEFHDGMINITFHDIIQRNITGAYVFPISKMIIENNQIKGLVMIYVNPQYLFYYLSQNRILSETEETFLVNRNGLLLSPTNSANDTIYATIIDTKNIQRALQNQESSFYEMNLHSNNILSFDNHRGEKVFGTYRTIPHTSWILLTEQNYDATLNQVFYIIQLYFGIAFLLICIGLLIAFYTSRRLTKPILELRDATKKIGDGFLDTQISISNRDEVGDLADSFRFMTKSLKQSRNEIQRYSEKLENLVDERTQELRQSEKKLKLYVEKLERNKIALTNIMMDMKRTMQAREIAEQDLKKSHAMLQELNEELEHKVKQRTEDIEKLLKQKDEFIHQLGHDLKNPLGPLINLLPILENKVHEDEDKEIITVLKRNVDYMKNLVKNTLELARLNSPKTKLNMESFNLKDELNDIIDNNHFLFKEKNMQVENKVSDVLMVHADKLRLEELLTNLLNNAVKYSDQNGNIWISAEEQNEFIQLSIQDDGIGMTTDQIERLFDEFYKADESRHDFDSSGLGMSIAKRIVEKHGGRIWVESKGLGMGSTFHFTLPRKDVEYG